MEGLNRTLAAVVAVLLGLLVVEGAARLFGMGPKPTMNRFDSTLGWTKEPSASIRRQTSEFDVTLETNSRGLREPESVGYDKPAGVTRILVVGDSFTLGYTVDSPDTITRQLEDRLRAEGRNVEVINAGTEGYSTDQEVLWLASEGVRYSPDVVVLQMYENDIFWNSQDSYLHYPKPRLPKDLAGGLVALPALVDPGLDPWLVRSTALGSFVWKFLNPPQVPMLANKPGIPAEWAVRLDDAAAGYAETAEALRGFATVAERSGIPAAVLVIPDKAQVDPAARQVIGGFLKDDRYRPERPHAAMVASARAAGLTVVDPLEALVEASEGGRIPLYFARDWHTNPTGNQVLAGAVADGLAAPALLGPAPRVAGAPAPRPEPPATWPRNVGIGVAIWLALSAAYRNRFATEGWGKSLLGVGALVGTVGSMIALVAWLSGMLPLWIGQWVAPLVVVTILGVAVFYLRKRLGVMGELFGTFVRRGQWYMLPVLAALLSIGALLVVAASSPWLAPFIYTLF